MAQRRYSRAAFCALPVGAHTKARATPVCARSGRRDAPRGFARCSSFVGGATLRQSGNLRAAAVPRRRGAAPAMSVSLDGQTVLAIGGGMAFLLSMALGANDVSNSLGTSVGTGAISMRQALLIGAVMEFSGAVLLGDSVTQTISNGVVSFTDSSLVSAVAPMCAVLLGSAGWVLAATALALPVSATHAVIGSLLGLGLTFGWQVHWQVVGSIAMTWLASPLLGGVIATAAHTLVRRLILDTPEPRQSLRRVLPGVTGVMAFVLSQFLLTRGQLGKVVPFRAAVVASAAVGGVGAVAGRSLGAKRASEEGGQEAAGGGWDAVQDTFKLLQVLTACLVAFSHGSNDVSNAIGPYSLVAQALTQRAAANPAQAAVTTPTWVLVLGGSGISVGLALFGRRVMRTVGEKITELVPTMGFSAEFSTALTVLLSSAVGIPVSTTHTLVGSVVALGFAEQRMGNGGGQSDAPKQNAQQQSLDLSLVRNIATSWVVTLPISAVITVASYILLTNVFNFPS